MRKENFVSGEYYHIYNRGVDKRDVFINKKDVERFVESICKFNQSEVIGSIANSRKTQIGLKALSGEPLVSIVAYCLNPNHFHFVLKQLVDGGISKFMQKLQGGYTYYFNVKNSRSGSLFQ
jgi:REP element-mobilizing transposase RayT